MLAALLLGSATAATWGLTALVSAPASRLAGPASSLLWSGLAASLVGVAFALTAGGSPAGSSTDWLFVALMALAYVVGCGLWLVAVSAGDVSVAGPIVACDGAIAAILAALAGQSVPRGVAVALGVIVCGILIVVRPAARREGESLRFSTGVRQKVMRTAVLAMGSAASFGVLFFLIGEVSTMHPLWVACLPRATATAVVATALLARTGSLPGTGDGLNWIAAYGTLDAIGFAVYAFAADKNTLIAAVAASQYGALAAIGGSLLLKERLAGRQIAGVCLLAAAAGAIALQSA